ncbi:MAG: hypothetical protein N2038_02245 [Geminicoccaceae bacterium]|nr:hypothetical protein [Geminicoccaceae bacterium]MCS7266806.1 hypothetical protein [Geminicoccaceae bacterium]MCX7629050.1 hypothetical protein [Geminicoccaceae bacterium]MDW8123827.1 hypothetical protein [Geminicoccaceae bacterium]MDW8341195.1 hypothetical protein [Geminicoccaceae bacterium]
MDVALLRARSTPGARTAPPAVPASAASGTAPAREAAVLAPLGLDLLSVWPLLLGPPGPERPFALLCGLFPLFLVHEASVRSCRRTTAARAPWLVLSALGLAAGFALEAGFGAALALLPVCVLLEARAGGPSGRAVARALAVALRVEAAALLAGFGPDPGRAALAGVVALVAFASLLPRAPRTGARPDDGERSSLFALLRLSAFAFAVGGWLALLERGGALAPEPALWAAASAVLLAAALWSALRPPPERAPGVFGLARSLPFLLGTGWLVLALSGAKALGLAGAGP